LNFEQIIGAEGVYVIVYELCMTWDGPFSPPERETTHVKRVILE